METLPPFKVLTWRELGTRYEVYAIEVGGERIHSQLGAYGAGEAEQRVREFMESAPTDMSPPRRSRLVPWWG